MSLFNRTVIVLFLGLSAVACSGGGGSNAGGIPANIQGNHSGTLTYVDPEGDTVVVPFTANLFQGNDIPTLTGQFLFSFSEMDENCYRDAQVDPASAVNGSTFTIAMDTVTGSRINATGNIAGRTLSGSFTASATTEMVLVIDEDEEEDESSDSDESDEDEDEFQPLCSSRSGQFRSNF